MTVPKTTSSQRRDLQTSTPGEDRSILIVDDLPQDERTSGGSIRRPEKICGRIR